MRPFEDWIALRKRHRNAWGAPGWKFDLKKLRDRWDWHHSETRQHFGDWMLVLKLGDGWEPLYRYLGIPVPDQPYPWANSGRPSGERNFASVDSTRRGC